MTGSDVYDNLRKEIPIENICVTDPIAISKLGDTEPVDGKLPYIDLAITFRNCYIKSLSAGDCTYNKRFTLEGCVVESTEFFACYLMSGITIEGCTFINDLMMMAAGGHNAEDKPIIIKNTIFYGLVDFCDALFYGPVEVSGCNFVEGTNLLGNKGKPQSIHFDQNGHNPDLELLVLKDNQGKLDLNGDSFDWKGVKWTGEQVKLLNDWSKKRGKWWFLFR